MFKILFAPIKLVIFSVIVLVLGNLIEIKGQSISDHVLVQIRSIENSSITQGIIEGIQKIAQKSNSAIKDRVSTSQSAIQKNGNKKERVLRETYRKKSPEPSLSPEDQAKLRKLLKSMGD